MSVLKIAACCVVGSIVFASLLSPKSVSTAAGSSASAAKGKPPLQIVSFTCHNESGYEFMEGEVTNRSDARIENLTAVGNTYAADGTFIKSDDAIVEYNPLMPNQTSPFRVMSTYNPMMSKCTISFKTLFGGQIAASS